MEEYLNEVQARFAFYKDLAERAIAQLSEEDLYYTPDPLSNSIALILKHLVGNLRSRWHHFLTEDGEKPDRHREREFILEPEDRPDKLRQAWEEAWSIVFGELAALRPEDLKRTVTIRQEPHSVIQAIERSLTHTAYHVGQIVYIAKHRKGPDFQSLSIPRGGLSSR
jgi:uncharacterized damage-inducible protein DinB